MQTADVVVVGAGVIGASVAYHLAARGCTNVVVLDCGSQPGQSSTGKATGGFRAQFNSTINVCLSLLSREKLRRFVDEIGVDSGYQPCGYLFLARRQHELYVLHRAQQVQHAAGLHEARTVTPDEIRSINPAIHIDSLIGGVFCPTDGFIRPLQILDGYTRAAQRLGVRFEYDRPVYGFGKDHTGRITAVYTPQGTISAGCVVNAAGAWAGAVARLAGVDLPVVPLRRQVASTQPTQVPPADMPMTIFAEDGFHLRVRDGRVLLLWPDTPSTTDPFDTTVDDQWIDEVISKARARIPCLADVPLDRQGCWAGLYEMSPDKHAMLGSMPMVENFYLVNGSSGHGVMHAPALGHLLAEIMLDGTAWTCDTTALRPTRFAEGQPNAVAELL
jgi:sarcosine oxidase subunit beta